MKPETCLWWIHTSLNVFVCLLGVGGKVTSLKWQQSCHGAHKQGETGVFVRLPQSDTSRTGQFSKSLSLYSCFIFVLTHFIPFILFPPSYLEEEMFYLNGTFLIT